MKRLSATLAASILAITMIAGQCTSVFAEPVGDSITSEVPGDSGDQKEEAGDQKEEAGDQKEEAGDQKEEAGDQKEEAGDQIGRAHV